MVETNNRIITLDGAYNLRDIGGIPIHTGRLMTQDILYRSDSLHKLTDKDREKLHKLGIKLICDLRTPKERKGKADKLHNNSNTRIESIPIYHLGYKFDPGFLRKCMMFFMNKFKDFDYVQFMKEYYIRIAFEHPDEIRTIFTLLTNEKNLPALLHCSGGKDRTGWLSAVLQLLSGVSMDMVYEDYLLTNKFVVAAMYESKRMQILFSLFNINRKNFKPVIEARIEYLRETLDLVFSKYKTIDTYLHEGCGMSIAIVNRLKKILTG